MRRYTIYCTPGQTRKALELGAPIKIECFSTETGDHWHEVIPTAEQMIGWLRERNIDCFVGKQSYARFMASVTTANCEFIYSKKYDTPKEATLAAVDAALEYLSKSKMI